MRCSSSSSSSSSGGAFLGSRSRGERMPLAVRVIDRIKDQADFAGSTGDGVMACDGPSGTFGVVGPGADGTVLTADSTQGSGLKWAAVPVTTTTSGIWVYSNNTAMAEPGTNKVRANAVPASTATQMALSSVGQGGTDAGHLLRSLVGGDTIYCPAQD